MAAAADSGLFVVFLPLKDGLDDPSLVLGQVTEVRQHCIDATATATATKARTSTSTSDTTTAAAATTSATATVHVGDGQRRRRGARCVKRTLLLRRLVVW